MVYNRDWQVIEICKKTNLRPRLGLKTTKLCSCISCDALIQFRARQTIRSTSQPAAAVLSRIREWGRSLYIGAASMHLVRCIQITSKQCFKHINTTRTLAHTKTFRCRRAASFFCCCGEHNSRNVCHWHECVWFKSREKPEGNQLFACLSNTCRLVFRTTICFEHPNGKSPTQSSQSASAIRSIAENISINTHFHAQSNGNELRRVRKQKS